MRKHRILFFILLVFSCTDDVTSPNIKQKKVKTEAIITNTSIVLLGTIQDAGYPQIGCKKTCCINAFSNTNDKREVVSLGLIDVPNKRNYLFEATPDIVRQMKRISQYGGQIENEITDGIFLTHAHIGHYTGLMYLGKESMSSTKTPIYVMPRMKDYLTDNGPWSQLVNRNNITLNEMENEKAIRLSAEIEVNPFLVPHRDEYSETVGYKIKGPNKTALFIPDIDKWEKREKDIVEEIKKVDYAFLDATFYSGKEINNRDISQIPHPFIIESLKTFDKLDKDDKNKVTFIHFNHTNPVIDIKSAEAQKVINAGFNIGRPNDVFEL